MTALAPDGEKAMGEARQCDDGDEADPVATTPCEDACFEVYLAKKEICNKKRTRKAREACWRQAMEEYVACAKKCRERGEGEPGVSQEVPPPDDGSGF